MAEYSPPVDQLLTYGRDKLGREWLNYLEDTGLTPTHIPDLIHLATDESLYLGDTDESAIYAPLHALRALGQLKAEAVIEPLLPLFHERDDDWLQETLPEMYGLIGAAAIPALTDFLADPKNGLWARVGACTSLEKIGHNYPDARDACIAALTHQLERFTRNSLDLNGFLVGSLTDLKAVEAAPVIERAFASRRVDLSIMGDWEDAQVALGLKEANASRKRKFDPFARLKGSVDFASAAMPYTPRDSGFGKNSFKPNKSKSKKKRK